MEGNLERSDPLDERQFQLVIKRLADSLSYGTDVSPFLGSGIEYAQSRPYVPGDPVKSIDWRVTARTGKYFIKEYEAPKRMPVYLVIDTSASMTVQSTTGGPSKYATAIQIAGGVALAALDRVSPVGVVGAGERDLRIRPSLGRQQIMEWLFLLRRFRYDETTSVARQIKEVSSSLSNRALFIVLSDLHDPEAISAMKLAGQRHDCLLLRMQDPAELGIKGAGIVRAREAETGREFTTNVARIGPDFDADEQLLRGGGIDQMTVRIDQPYLARLRQFLNSRGALGRTAR